MSDEWKFALFVAAMFTAPSLVVYIILRSVLNKSVKWSPRKRRFWRTFWWCYFILQTLYATLNFLDGIQSTGNEDVPVWGITTMVVWAFAFTLGPLVSVLFAVISLAVGKVKSQAPAS